MYLQTTSSPTRSGVLSASPAFADQCISQATVRADRKTYQCTAYAAGLILRNFGQILRSKFKLAAVFGTSSSSLLRQNQDIGLDGFWQHVDHLQSLSAIEA